MSPKRKATRLAGLTAAVASGVTLGPKFLRMPISTLRGRLQDSPLQTRAHPFDPERDKAFVDTISKSGIFQPVALTMQDGKEQYQIVWGHRRIAAALYLYEEFGKDTEVPVLLYQNTAPALATAIENVQRRDLSPMEAAWLVQRLQEMGHSAEEIQALGIGRSTYYYLLKLLDADPEVQEALAQISIGVRAAAEIAGMPKEQAIDVIRRLSSGEQWRDIRPETDRSGARTKGESRQRQRSVAESPAPAAPLLDPLGDEPAAGSEAVVAESDLEAFLRQRGVSPIEIEIVIEMLRPGFAEGPVKVKRLERWIRTWRDVPEEVRASLVDFWKQIQGLREVPKQFRHYAIALVNAVEEER